MNMMTMVEQSNCRINKVFRSSITMNICIVKHGNVGLSETFIRGHVEALAAKVTLVHGNIPYIGGRPVISQSVLSRAFRKIQRLVLCHQWDWEITSSYMVAFRRSQVCAVLAEYGPAGPQAWWISILHRTLSLAAA